MASVTSASADEIRSTSATYLRQVETCVAHLPDAMDAYGTDSEAFVAAVDRLSTVESECDATLRDLRTLVGESLPPNFTDVYLRVDDVVRLYARIDAVPNRAERFARELVAMRPSLATETRETLGAMATLTAEATTVLVEATDAYVESLLTPGDPARVTEDVETISALESEADGHKYTALRRAFDGSPTADALAVRELLLTLDAAMDAAEDAAEHLLSMSSTDR